MDLMRCVVPFYSFYFLLSYILSLSFSLVLKGKLKEWSLVLYGTSEQPYSMRREQARSAELPMDYGGDLTEEYIGESPPQHRGNSAK